MIDTKELRRLTQAAMHPVTKGRWMRLFGERTVYDRMEDGCRGIPVVSTPISPPHPFEAACLDFIAAANPAAITELLDRTEAAESDAAHQKALADSALRAAEGWEEKCNAMRADKATLQQMMYSLKDRLEAAEKECDNANAAAAGIALQAETLQAERDTLRAKIERTEQKEPVACKNCNGMGDRFDPSGEKIPCDLCESHLEEIRSLVAEAAHDIISGSDFWLSISLAAKKIYALPGAQAQNVPKAVAYLDLGTGGYMDIGTDLPDEALAALPKGRHMLGVIGTYGVDGYVPAQPAPSMPDVDSLAQFIREVDGSHQLGAGVLAERIAEWLKAAKEAKP